MKKVKVILVIIIIIALAFVGYQGYLAYEKWQRTQKSRDQLLIESLKANEGAIITLSTKLSDIEMKVVNDTLKTVVEIIPDKSYESLKEQVIELKKDEDVNKDEIKVLREQLSEQRKNFLASDDTILIKDIDGNSLLLYRDSDGALQPASAQIDKIIEHKDVAVVSKKEIVNDVTNWNIKFGAYYTLDKTYGVIISKGIFTVKDYSLNASLLLSDFEDIKYAIGADIDYSIGNNLNLGVGYNSDKDIYVKLQYEF